MNKGSLRFQLTAHRGEDSHKEISNLDLVWSALQKPQTLEKHASRFIRLEQPQQRITSSVVSLGQKKSKTVTRPSLPTSR